MHIRYLWVAISAIAVVTGAILGVEELLSRGSNQVEKIFAGDRGSGLPVYVRSFVRQGPDAGWSTATNAEPGDQIQIMIAFENVSDEPFGAVVGNNLPKYLSYVDGSTLVQRSGEAHATPPFEDRITLGGVDVGRLGPGDKGSVTFRARVAPVRAYESCGAYDVRNVGIVRPVGDNEFYNTAKIVIGVRC